MLETVLLVIFSIAVGAVLIGAFLWIANFLVLMPVAMVNAIIHREHRPHHFHPVVKH